MESSFVGLVFFSRGFTRMNADKELATKRQKSTKAVIPIQFVPCCAFSWPLFLICLIRVYQRPILFVLPGPLIERLVFRATISAFSNTRRKFSPRIFRMSRSL